MKIHDFIGFRGFGICRGVLTQGDTFVNPNRSAAAEYNQLLYAVRGSGMANDVPLTEGNHLHDLSHFKDREITYTSTSPVSIWVAFNPILRNTRLAVTLLDSPTSVEIRHDTLETYIVPLEGTVEVNGKTLESFKSGRLLIGKKAQLTVPEGSVCTLVNIIKE